MTGKTAVKAGEDGGKGTLGELSDVLKWAIIGAAGIFAVAEYRRTGANQLVSHAVSKRLNRGGGQ